VNRSIWTIALIGFISAVVLTGGMLLILWQFRDSPLSKTTKIAVSVKSEYRFDSVGAELQPGAQKTALVIHYETRTDSKFNSDFQVREMKAVADFAAGKAEPFDRRMIDEIRVRRTEVRGSGCWQRNYVSNNTFPNPYRGQVPPETPAPK